MNLRRMDSSYLLEFLQTHYGQQVRHHLVASVLSASMRQAALCPISNRRAFVSIDDNNSAIRFTLDLVRRQLGF